VSLAPELLAAARELELRARRSVREGLGGRWRSALRGAGVEFAEVREYVPGDDARTLDWNVTARTGRLTVKRFEEEREQTLYFVVDLSRSCLAGGGVRPWRTAAAELVALAGSAAAEAGDRSGLVVVTDRVERVIAPRHGIHHVLAMATEVLSFAPRHATSDPANVVTEFLRLRTRPALVFWITDGADEWPTPGLAELARRHDLVVTLLRGPWSDPPRAGLVRFADPEASGRAAVRTVDLADRRVHAALLRRIAAERAEWRARTLSARADLLELSTEASCAAPLLAWCKRRERELVR
jgi:uncharacterized protein (DUF58 family)